MPFYSARLALPPADDATVDAALDRAEAAIEREMLRLTPLEALRFAARLAAWLNGGDE